MKFQVFSDIHLEFFEKNSKDTIPYIEPLEDYLFLVGDIGKLHIPNYKIFFDYCSNNWKLTFYILGNHEFYHSSKTHKNF